MKGELPSKLAVSCRTKRAAELRPAGHGPEAQPELHSVWVAGSGTGTRTVKISFSHRITGKIGWVFIIPVPVRTLWFGAPIRYRVYMTECRWSAERVTVDFVCLFVRHVQQETVALVSELMTLKEQFELEKKGRVDREQLLVKRLNELQYGLDAKLEAEIALRQEQLNHLKREVEQLVR